MPQVQGSECPSDECTRCEEGPAEKQSDGIGSEPPRLPTAADCAKQLSSIFNSETDVEAPIQNEGANQLCIVQSSSKPHAAATPSSGTELQQIGRGGDEFEMHVIVDHCHDLCLFGQSNSADGSPNKSVWLSYRLFEAVHQSEIFSLSHTDDFAPFLSSFLIRSSPQEIAEYFNAKKSGTLRIHLCTEGEVLGTALVDLRLLIAIEDSDGEDIEGRMTQDEYPVIPRKANQADDVQASGSPRISVRLCLNRPLAANSPKAPHSTAVVHSSISSQTTKIASVDRSSSPIRKQPTENTIQVPSNGETNPPPRLAAEREERLSAREAALSKKEKDLYDAAAALQRKQSEWEAWRHKQELEWHEKLREKEAAMMRVVEERVCNLEKERLASVDVSKKEYERLEARLRKALIEVEAKERHLTDLELGHTNERKRKLAELALQEKLLKEEVKHSIEIERAKVAAAVDQAVAAQKSAAEANKKVKQVEAAMDQLRVDQRKTPEVSLMHKLAELKGQLADGERRIEAIKAEKAQVTAEKEQFRSNVHKLARALRHEREKAAKKVANAKKEVRLSYDADEKSFVLGGGQDEITRILADLNRLSQAKQGSACQTPVAASTPTRQPLSNRQNQSGGSGMTHGPPLPSPQSLCPTPIIRTHSPIIGAPAQHAQTRNE